MLGCHRNPDMRPCGISHWFRLFERSPATKFLHLSRNQGRMVMGRYRPFLCSSSFYSEAPV